MKVVLFRHGQTRANVQRLFCGSTDEVVTMQGIRVLRENREKGYDGIDGPFRSFLFGENGKKLDHVYVTDLIRTQTTAEVLFPGVKQIPVPGLRETDFGVWEAKSVVGFEDTPEFRAWIETGDLPAEAQAEKRADFVERIANAFCEVMQQEGVEPGAGSMGIYPYGESRHSLGDYVSLHPLSGEELFFDKDEEVLVFVLHGGSIMALLYALGVPAAEYKDGWLDNGEAFVCEVI